MLLSELEDEIKEIEKIQARFESGSLEWNNIENIIQEKKKQIEKLKYQTCEEDATLESLEEYNIQGGGCSGDCNSCGINR